MDVATPMRYEHGTEGAYLRDNCRCQACREKNTERLRALREARFARRELVGDRLVAPVAARLHGHPSTYNNHGCRCRPCTAAATDYRTKSKRGRGDLPADDVREDRA